MQLKKLVICAVFSLGTASSFAQAAVITSPDKLTNVTVEKSGQEIRYSVERGGAVIIQPSRLGLITSIGDLSSNLSLTSVSPEIMVTDQYELFTGKKKIVNYRANTRTIKLTGSGNLKLEIIFQVSDDGVAFRYYIPAEGKDSISVTDESTTFTLDTSSRGYLQTMQIAKTGFEQTNPAYEDNYRQNIPVTMASPSGAGWVYPALFQQNKNWLLITEAGLDENIVEQG